MAKRDQLDPYHGPLTPAQVAEGMNAAGDNSRRLLDDAKLLYSHKRLASALALAVLSIEESGKTAVLREISYTTDPKALKAAWRNYRSHTFKNAIWIVPDLIRRGARSLVLVAINTVTYDD